MTTTEADDLKRSIIAQLTAAMLLGLDNAEWLIGLFMENVCRASQSDLATLTLD